MGYTSDGPSIAVDSIPPADHPRQVSSTATPTGPARYISFEVLCIMKANFDGELTTLGLTSATVLQLTLEHRERWEYLSVFVLIRE